MHDRKVIPTVDPLMCTGCRMCIRVCPDRTLSMIGEIAAVTGDH